MAPYISRLTNPSSCCVSVVHLTPVVFEIMILLVFMRVFMPCFFSLCRSSVAEPKVEPATTIRTYFCSKSKDRNSPLASIVPLLWSGNSSLAPTKAHCLS